MSDNFPSDVCVSLAQLEQDDPLARQRYQIDPSYRADVHEHARRARQLADKTTSDQRDTLLQDADARRKYAADPLFRALVDETAIEGAVAVLQADQAAPTENKARH